jgi:hypothetical protein
VGLGGGVGTAVGLGLGDGLGLGLGLGLGDDVGLGLGLGPGSAVGLGLGLALGVGVGPPLGLGLEVGLGLGLGDGLGLVSSDFIVMKPFFMVVSSCMTTPQLPALKIEGGQHVIEKSSRRLYHWAIASGAELVSTAVMSACCCVSEVELSCTPYSPSHIGQVPL